MKERKSTIILISTAFLVLIAAITNPDPGVHRTKVREWFLSQRSAQKDWLSRASQSDQLESASTALGYSLGVSLFDKMLEGIVVIDNYVLFSITKLRLNDEETPVAVGVFGNVLFFSKTTPSRLTKNSGYLKAKGRSPFDTEDSDSRPTFEFTEEAIQPVDASNATLEIVNRFGNVDLFVNDSPGIKVKLQEKVKADNDTEARQISNQLKIVLERKDKGLFSLSTNRENLSEEWRRGLETHFSVWVPKSTSTTVTLSNEHGQISLDGISGSHYIKNAHGSVAVKNVDGSLRIENTYGPVTVVALTGDCNIKNKYGAVDVEGVRGKTEIENAHGSVDVRKLKGVVNLSSRHGRIVCVDLESGLIIDGKHADVRGQNIGGDVQVATAYRNVELENVLGSINIKEEHGDIAIKNSQPQVKPIFIDAEYSGVEITLPKESRFQLDASSKDGKFESGFESINLRKSTLGKNLKVRGSNGTGGPSINIHTSYRSIRLSPS